MDFKPGDVVKLTNKPHDIGVPSGFRGPIMGIVQRIDRYNERGTIVISILLADPWIGWTMCESSWHINVAETKPVKLMEYEERLSNFKWAR